MNQPCPLPTIPRKDIIQRRMESYKETRAEAEAMIDFAERMFTEEDLRKTFYKMIEEGDLL